MDVYRKCKGDSTKYLCNDKAGSKVTVKPKEIFPIMQGVSGGAAPVAEANAMFEGIPDQGIVCPIRISNLVQILDTGNPVTAC